jgi:hypothetical protein
MAYVKWVLRLAIWSALGLLLTLRGVAAQPVKAGEGAYHLGPKAGDKGLPAAPLRTEAMLKQAAPTSQWYSTLIFNPKPFPIFVQPMTVRTTEQGFEMALPSKEVTPTDRRDTEVAYPHRDPLLLSPAGFESGPAKLAGVGDWSIDISMARGADDMRVTVAHGNPYAYIQLTRGDLRLRLPAAGERFDGGADARVLALRVKGKAYALFAPTGANSA